MHIPTHMHALARTHTHNYNLRPKYKRKRVAFVFPNFGLKEESRGSVLCDSPLILVFWGLWEGEGLRIITFASHFMATKDSVYLISFTPSEVARASVISLRTNSGELRNFASVTRATSP